MDNIGYFLSDYLSRPAGRLIGIFRELDFMEKCGSWTSLCEVVGEGTSGSDKNKSAFWRLAAPYW